MEKNLSLCFQMNPILLLQIQYYLTYNEEISKSFTGHQQCLAMFPGYKKYQQCL